MFQPIRLIGVETQPGAAKCLLSFPLNPNRAAILKASADGCGAEA